MSHVFSRHDRNVCVFNVIQSLSVITGLSKGAKAGIVVGVLLVIAAAAAATAAAGVIYRRHKISKLQGEFDLQLIQQQEIKYLYCA